MFEENLSDTTHSPMFSLDSYPNLPKQYRLLSLLGEGAFSSVYKGEHIETKDVVAIKIINKLNLSTKQLFNINNEIHVMKTLNKSGGQENVLRLIESFQTEENCFLILEYCDGGEIFNKIIEYTYFSEDLTRHVFLQLLNAISFLHSRNVVHRDIKPENLLFKSIPMKERSAEEFKASLRKSDDESKVDEGAFMPGIGGGGVGMIKLADFGLAKQLKPDPAQVGSSHAFHGNLKTPCGTAGYTAPEVIHCGVETTKRRFKSSKSKANFYSKAVDIWSLGCFLYTALCGFPPFYDDNSEALTRKILTADYVFLEPWWDEISDDAKDLISKMLVVNTKNRITLDEIYNHPWMANAVALESQSYFPETYNLNSSSSSVSLTPSTHSTLRKIPSPLGKTKALVSPGVAIKQLFNNPAMSHVSTKSLAHYAQYKREKLKTDSKNVKFDVGTSFISKKPSIMPRTPNPITNVSFKDVFQNSGYSFSDDSSADSELSESDVNDDANESDVLNESDLVDSDLADSDADSELGDVQSIHEFSVEEDALVDSANAGLTHLSISSTSFSSESSKSTNNGDEYATRSSSIISGANGDFKFTLNLNDSNLLRRRSSVKSSTA